MRFSSASIIVGFVATLAVAAPCDVAKEKRSLADLLAASTSKPTFSNSSSASSDSSSQNSNSGFSNGFSSNFNLDSFSFSQITEILQSFNLNSFNSQFGTNFSDNSVETILLLALSNSFGNSDFGNFGGSNFDLSSFSNSFNSQFNTNWDSLEVEQLLLQLGLIEQSGNSNSGSNVVQVLESGFQKK